MKNKKYLFLTALLMVSIVMPLAFSRLTSAATLKQTSARLGRLSISATANNDLLVTLKVNTTASVSKVLIVFPTGFSITGGTPTVATTGFPNTPAITALPSSTTLAASASAVNKDILISNVGVVNATTLYGFIIPAGTIQNPASAGQYSLKVCTETVSGATGDNCTGVNVLDATNPVPVSIVGTSGTTADQVTVTATVSPNFSFSLTGTGCPNACSDTISTVDPTTVQTSSGVTMTVGTNSPLGYTAYVKSGQSYLRSTGSSGTDITNGTFDGTADSVAAGTTKYTFLPQDGAVCTSCSGTRTYDGEYSNGAGAAISSGTAGGAFNGTVYSSFVSRSGYTNADTIVLKERIAVANTVIAASDYTDTLTIVAAGNF